jgi:hypothetical protein
MAPGKGPKGLPVTCHPGGEVMPNIFMQPLAKEGER